MRALQKKTQSISLLDYVENPRGFPGDIDVVYTVPCTRADVYKQAFVQFSTELQQALVGQPERFGTYCTTGEP